jgi:hypothetical protein
MSRSTLPLIAALSSVVLAWACGGSSDDSGGANGPPGGPGSSGGASGGLVPNAPPPKADGKCPHDISTAPGATANGMTIPSAHPRLWWTPDRLARAKTWLASHPVETRADMTLNLLFSHAVAGTDCKSVVDWATGFTIPDQEFNVASDDMRWNGEFVILTYDWCHDQLSDAQKTLLISRWNTYVDKAIALSWGGPTMPSSNYYWGYLRDGLEWGIATYGENPNAQKYLDDSITTRWTNSFLPLTQGKLNGDARGGVFLEGTQYGAYMANYPVVPFMTASLMGRTLYDETDFYKAGVYYVIYSTPPGPTTSIDGTKAYETFPFGDDETYIQHQSSARVNNFMSQAAQTWDCLDVGKDARGWLKQTGTEAEPHVASVDKGGDAKDPSNLPLDYYATGVRFFYGRTAWAPTATAFMWQLGDAIQGEAGHTHLDYGNFQIWRGGKWLTREATGYDDTYTGYGGTGELDSADTLAHNAIIINGLGDAHASQNGVQGPPVVKRLESQPDYAYAHVDISNAYRNPDTGHPERDNPAAGHVERELVFFRGLETTVILDRVLSNATGGKTAEQIEKAFIAHFEGNPTIENPNHVTYTAGGQALRMSVLVPSAPTTRVIDEKKAKNSPNGIFRVEVVTSGVAQSYFLTVLQAKDAAAAALNPTVTEDGASFTVTLDGSNSIVFQKGQSSAGGTITVKGAQKNLRADVQPIALSDSGPVWQ